MNNKERPTTSESIPYPGTWDYNMITSVVIEQERGVTTPLLYDHEGNPYVKPKIKMGFHID